MNALLIDTNIYSHAMRGDTEIIKILQQGMPIYTKDQHFNKMHLKLSLCFPPETISQSMGCITENALRTVKIMSLQMISPG